MSWVARSFRRLWIFRNGCKAVEKADGLVKRPKKSIELKLFRKGSAGTWSSNYSFRFQMACV